MIDQREAPEILPQAVVAKPQRFTSIQDLRGIAALAVVLYHVDCLPTGYAGVDIFFVISGFIIGNIGTRERPGPFLIKRLIRIVPLYWALTATMCLLAVIPHMYSRFTFNIYTLGQSLLFIPYADSSGSIFPILPSGWTLAYEMFFYLLFFIGLIARLPRPVLPMLLLLLVIAGQSFAPVGPVLKTYTSPMLLEFVAGLLLAEFTMPSSRMLGVALLVSSVALFAIASMTGVLDASGLDPSQDRGLLRVLWLGIPAAALVGGALALERAGHWLRIMPLTLIGDASYSLYLLQALVMGFASKVLHVSMALNAVVVTGLSIAGALVCHHLFEAPASRLLLNFFGLQRRNTAPPAQGRLPATALKTNL